MAELSSDIRFLRGIGELRAKALSKLGITTLRELICFFPRLRHFHPEIRHVSARLLQMNRF